MPPILRRVSSPYSCHPHPQTFRCSYGSSLNFLQLNSILLEQRQSKPNTGAQRYPDKCKHPPPPPPPRVSTWLLLGWCLLCSFLAADAHQVLWLITIATQLGVRPSTIPLQITLISPFQKGTLTPKISPLLMSSRETFTRTTQGSLSLQWLSRAGLGKVGSTSWQDSWSRRSPLVLISEILWDFNPQTPYKWEGAL